MWLFRAVCVARVSAGSSDTQAYRPNQYLRQSNAPESRVCAHLLKATPQQLRVVVVHQPVHVLRASDEHDRLNGWEAAVRAWAAAGADVVMGGHIHLPYVCELSAQVDGMARRMWCVQAGTAVSSRIRREAPNSVNLIELMPNNTSSSDAPGCSVQRWDYQKSGNNAHGSAVDGQFALAHTSVLNLQRS